MKRIIYGVLGFCLMNCAAVSADNQQEAFARIDDIHLQTQSLQREVAQLRAELNRLEHSKKSCNPASWRYRLQSFWNPYDHPLGMNSKCHKDCESSGTPTESGFSENSRDLDDFARVWGSPRNLLLLASLGATVTTSPFLGLRSAFDASDLIVNLPTMNEDLRFLKEHVQLEKKLRCYGVQLPDRPIIELGGKIEGIMFAQEDWNDGSTRSDVNLGSARLDILIEVSKGVHGFMALNMDSSNFDLLNNSNLNIQLAGSGSRIFNSRVFVSRAFVTIGDLNCIPLYFTIGQMFVPFGRFASNMVTSTLTVDLARTNERALLLGYYKNGLYASVYGFRGESNVNAPGVNQWGANLGYEKTFANGSLNIGGGYIGSISDATSIQVTGASTGFFGFAINPAIESLEHRVPAYDVHGEFSIGKFNLFGEYIWTERSFDVLDLNFNGHGANLSASNLELAYNFKLANCPASLAVGYGTTTDALPILLPKSSFTTAFNISIWKDTIESLEFRHDDNYDSSDFGGGVGALPAVINSMGGSRNTYTAQIGIYF